MLSYKDHIDRIILLSSRFEELNEMKDIDERTRLSIFVRYLDDIVRQAQLANAEIRGILRDSEVI